MSFVSKALKKVFSFGKKIFSGVKKAFGNKWFRAAFAIALTMFASGSSSNGGFSQTFAQAQAQATANGTSGIGAFFSAVGTTIADGFGNITSAAGGLFGENSATDSTVLDAIGAVGVGKGNNETVTTELTTVPAPHAVPASSSAVLNAFPPGGSTAQVTPTGQNVPPNKPGLLNRMFATMFSSSNQGQFMRSAIIGGISFWEKSQEAKEEKRLRRNLTVAGDTAFGGSAELPPGFIRKPLVSSSGADSKAKELAGQGTETIQSRKSFGRGPSPSAASPLLGKATQIADLRDNRGNRRNQRQGLLGANYG